MHTRSHTCTHTLTHTHTPHTHTPHTHTHTTHTLHYQPCIVLLCLVSFFTDGLWKLARYEGVRGMYKGFAPGLFGVSHGAIQFMSYEEMKKAYCSRHGLPHNTKLVGMCDRQM